jgi:hypothetical protein
MEFFHGPWNSESTFTMENRHSLFGFLFHTGGRLLILTELNKIKIAKIEGIHKVAKTF